ncbi:MAG: hypothetical protein WC556_14085, partial [Candidatus Methanoperedens sp.]
MTKILVADGYEVTYASNGVEALEKLDEKEYLSLYSQKLMKKLENKVVELENANKKLEVALSDYGVNKSSVLKFLSHFSISKSDISSISSRIMAINSRRISGLLA